MSELRALYERVMDNHVDFDKGLFVVRIWDGMDGCWSNCTEAVPAEEALRVWSEKTKRGTKQVKFSEIDYYCIFPADTKMVWSGDNEMFRDDEEDDDDFYD